MTNARKSKRNAQPPNDGTAPSDELEAPTMAIVYGIWASADHWPLEDAVRLLLGLYPRLLETSALDPRTARRLAVHLELARNCAGDSLRLIDAMATPADYRVRPADALAWAQRKGVTIPPGFQSALQEAQQGETAEPPSKVRNDQRHRERCRAIAALLWAADPTITIAGMGKRPEIQQHGCEARQYTANTLRGWLKDLSPKREPGRPPKQKN